MYVKTAGRVLIDIYIRADELLDVVCVLILGSVLSALKMRRKMPEEIANAQFTILDQTAKRLDTKDSVVQNA